MASRRPHHGRLTVGAANALPWQIRQALLQQIGVAAKASNSKAGLGRCRHSGIRTDLIAQPRRTLDTLPPAVPSTSTDLVFAVVCTHCSVQKTPHKGHQRSSSKDIGSDCQSTEESLDRALHHYAPAFQDGIFEGPHAAVSVLSEEAPALASQVVAAAKLDLVKRQSISTNSTSISTTSSLTTTTTTDFSSSTSTSDSITSSTSQSSTTPTSAPLSTSPIASGSSSGNIGSSSVVSSLNPTGAFPSEPPGLGTAPVAPSSMFLSSSQAVQSSGEISNPSLLTDTSAPVVTSPPPVQSTPAPTPSSTDVFIPIPETSVDDFGSTAVSTFLSASPVTASVTVPITTTDAAGNPITTNTVVPALIFQTTDAQGNLIMVTDTLPGSGPTSTDNGNGVATVTASVGVITTTLPPVAGGVVQSVVTETTEVAGLPTVITKTIVVLPSNVPGVDAQPADSTAEPGATPSLQAGAAMGSRKVGKEVVALVGGAVGVAMLL
ncbi:hypothetical protein FH972_021706 [Carpinus fangiana]|uniref:Uncharacterized protein n=1 Tax=Carpinus fangiana TaxID=176857 RepID=A0A5N6KS76_9ROSI|nr:hypothetical protein FH972_021706 [Carpinus fangiana]